MNTQQEARFQGLKDAAILAAIGGAFVALNAAIWNAPLEWLGVYQGQTAMAAMMRLLAGATIAYAFIYVALLSRSGWRLAALSRPAKWMLALLVVGAGGVHAAAVATGPSWPTFYGAGAVTLALMLGGLIWIAFRESRPATDAH